MVLRQLVKKSVVIGFINGCCLIDSYMDGESAFVDIFQVCCQEHTVPITCHLSVLRGFCTVIRTVPGRGCGLLYREGDFAFPPPLQMPKTSDLLHHCFYFLILASALKALESPSEFLLMQSVYCPSYSQTLLLSNPALWRKVSNLLMVTSRSG